MPMPEPRDGEKEDDFVSRCMGDSTMNRDFKDQSQRYAVCQRQWDDAHKGGKQALAWPIPDTPSCFHHHMGFWCVLVERMLPLFHAWQLGQPLPLSRTPVEIEAVERRPYQVSEQGTAIIPLMGPLTKGGSLKFDGTSTVRTRRALRMAASDEDVGSLLLHIDSPGGHVAGIEALAAEVASIRGRKPIVAQVDDLGASAAYWVASQADAIYANATSEIGSIGTIAVVEDTSSRMDRLGVKVHVISTGPYKGVGVEGAPVSEAAIDYLKDRVAAINQHFLTAVRGGRRFTEDQVAAVSDGRVFIADQAHRLHLIDGVQSLDATLVQLAASGVRRAPHAPGFPARAQREAQLAKVKSYLQRNAAHGI